MSKKILTVLAPVAALIAFMVVPTLAQATTAQAPAGTALAQGATVIGQSVNPLFTTSTGAKLQCAKGILSGTVASDPGAADVTGTISSDSFTNATGGACASDGAFGGTADITTNAGTESWTLQIQQPEANGAIVGHVTNGHALGKLRISMQIQNFGFSSTTCVYDTSTAGLQVTGSTSLDTLTAEANTFTRSSGSESLCGNTGEFSGSFQLENGSGEAAFIDMT